MDEDAPLPPTILDEAWSVIANAYLAPLNWHDDNLTSQHKIWVKAAENWRDKWHKLMTDKSLTPEQQALITSNKEWHVGWYVARINDGYSRAQELQQILEFLIDNISRTLAWDNDAGPARSDVLTIILLLAERRLRALDEPK